MIRSQTVTIGDLLLDNGTLLTNVEQRVTITGTPRPDGSNVVLAPHALTGSSDVAQWWPGIVGAGALFDPQAWCIIGINVLGGCYGSTGPSSRTGFPRVTVADIVRAQQRALDELGFEQLAFVAGGSLGGMQALQWALDAPERAGTALVIGAHDHQSTMAIALNAIQRECLELDPVRGLRTARKLAMLTYKSEELLAARHGRQPDRNVASRFDVEGYLDHQADRFAGRMDAATYTTLTHAMDSFDVRHRANDPHANIVFVGITGDWLFRAQRVRAAAARFGARYLDFESDHGHDAFLAETGALATLLEDIARRPVPLALESRLHGNPRGRHHHHTGDFSRDFSA